jgi:hypothetical protein
MARTAPYSTSEPLGFTGETALTSTESRPAEGSARIKLRGFRGNSDLSADYHQQYHAYAQGGHAFGLMPSKLPVSGWPQLVEKWLGTIGMIPQ